jgi:radical SAM superfamily enzyme YgiQ (UPF0313 family)
VNAELSDRAGGVQESRDKVLLLLLPFWDPQIPPMGLASLKRAVQEAGYRVKAVDANVEDRLGETLHRYFEVLQAHIPARNRGNFYKVAHDVLDLHLMAYIHYSDRAGYLELLKIALYKTFYLEPQEEWIWELHALVREFYQRLEGYVLELLAAEKPSVLGISVFSGTLPASLFTFRLAKEKYPQLMTVMGGGVFSGQLSLDSPELDYFLQQTPYIDKIIIGEGEILLRKLLEGRLAGDRRLYTLADIGGETLDLSGTGPPDFSDFDLTYYPYLVAEGSRSCPFQCQFCAETVQWGRYRKKKTRQVVAQFGQLQDRYRSRLFLLSDSLLNPIIGDLARGCLEAGLSVYWDGFLRVHPQAGDTANTLLWRQGGFYRARLGVESGSQLTLDRMGKKITLAQIKETIAALAYAGIKTTTYWVVGFPGESETDFQATLDLIEELADDIYEADGSPFWFFLKGQVGSQQWSEKSRPLYPEAFRHLFMVQTYILDLEPGREEIYRRLWRFVEHCQRLGIPNPYSLKDVHQADERWKKLHPNAVPTLVELKDDGLDRSENREIKELLDAGAIPEDEGDFGF